MADAWKGKPAAIATLSPRTRSAASAPPSLRQSLGVLDMPTLQQPGVYLGNGDKLLAADAALHRRRRAGSSSGSSWRRSPAGSERHRAVATPLRAAHEGGTGPEGRLLPPCSMALGRRQQHITGVTSRARKVEVIRPPMIAQAIGSTGRCSAASGIRPPIAVAEVSRIGGKRISPARSIASSAARPARTAG